MLGLTVNACSFPSRGDKEEDKYTVYTTSMFYSEYKTYFSKDLDEQEFQAAEIPDSSFPEVKALFSKNEKHACTEEEIYNWFFNIGFLDYEADTITTWLIKRNKAIVIIRLDDIIYLFMIE